MFELSIVTGGKKVTSKNLFVALVSTAIAFFKPKNELDVSHIKDPHACKWALFDALIGCIERGNDEGVLMAIQLKADLNLYDMYDDMPLHLAVLPENNLRASTIRKMLEAGAKINHTNATDCTPWVLFVSHLPKDRIMDKNQEEIARTLLEFGAITETIHVDVQEIPVDPNYVDDYEPSEEEKAFPWMDLRPEWTKPQTERVCYVRKPLDYVANPENRKILERIIDEVTEKQAQAKRPGMRHAHGRVVQEQACLTAGTHTLA